jgi:prepilin-type N-terminal cleavage/methylation domain-containing protein
MGCCNQAGWRAGGLAGKGIPFIRPSARPPVRLSGFTLIELMVSISILLIISVAVSGELTTTKYAEELASSARVVAGSLRDLQAFAQASMGVKTCQNAGLKNLVCEIGTGGCSTVCGTLMPTSAVGAVLIAGGTSVQRFAEVDVGVSNIDRRLGAGEDFGTRQFISGLAGTKFVTVKSLDTGACGPVSPATVTFERQNGSMRIQPCDTPTPNTPLCGVTPCGNSNTLTIMLEHSKTKKTRTIRLNAITGKISLE